jgi:hypothetical protein
MREKKYGQFVELFGDFGMIIFILHIPSLDNFPIRLSEWKRRTE